MPAKKKAARTKTKAPRIAAYLRVSTDEQKHDSQREDILRWARRQRIKPAALAWYEDQATGNHMRRPELNRLQEDLDRGAIDTVVICRLDRLSRKVYEGMRRLGEWCKAEVRVVVLSHDLDLDGPLGAATAALLLAFAQIEQDVRKARQADGIAAARKRGVYKKNEGRPKGSTKASPQRVKQLVKKGMKKAEIARALGVSRNTVYEYLKQDG